MGFLSANEYGHDAFLRAYNMLPIPAGERPQALARWLGVTPGTVMGWLTGRRNVPRAVALAVWLESAHGREAMHCQLFNEARWHAAHAGSLIDAQAGQKKVIDALRRELAEAKTAAHAGAALAGNDSMFSDAPAAFSRQRYRA